MLDDSTRLAHARWLLDRMHSSIVAIDAKVAVSVGLNTGMLGGLAAAYAVSRPAGSGNASWAILAMALATIALVVSIFCAAMAAIPRTRGTSRSLVYFGAIAQQRGAEFVAALAAVETGDLLADLSTQIHRNAEIATTKNWWIRQGLVWSFLATIPWLVSLALLVAR